MSEEFDITGSEIISGVFSLFETSVYTDYDYKKRLKLFYENKMLMQNLANLNFTCSGK